MIPARKPGRKNGLLDDPKKRGKLIRLLGRTNMTITEIAAEMGYSVSMIEKASRKLREEGGAAA